eukprot:1588247-Pyramimonas_sp.AAC.1
MLVEVCLPFTFARLIRVVPGRMAKLTTCRFAPVIVAYREELSAAQGVDVGTKSSRDTSSQPSTQARRASASRRRRHLSQLHSDAGPGSGPVSRPIISAGSNPTPAAISLWLSVSGIPAGASSNREASALEGTLGAAVRRALAGGVPVRIPESVSVRILLEGVRVEAVLPFAAKSASALAW